MSSSSQGYIRQFSWLTPGTASKCGHHLNRSLLLWHPIVLARTLKKLDFFDVTALLRAGNRDLSQAIRRLCTIMAIQRHIGRLQPEDQPILTRDPFASLSGFSAIATLSIISPTWKIPAYKVSPLIYLPSTLQHLTIWAGTCKFENLHTLVIVAYRRLFQNLETLRLCATTLQSNKTIRWYPLIEICKPLPQKIRFLSLVGSELLSRRATSVCDSQTSGLTRTSWMLPELECFEWGGTGTNDSENMTSSFAASKPPKLRLFRHLSECMLSYFPRKKMPTQHDAIQGCGGRNIFSEVSPELTLQTLHLHAVPIYSHQLALSIPWSITDLHLSNEHGVIVLPNNMDVLFPCMRSFSTLCRINLNKMRFPSELTSLAFKTPMRSEIEDVSLFSIISPPASLTRLSTIGSDISGLHTHFPSSVRHFNLEIECRNEYLHQQVLRFLPSSLNHLSLRLSQFPPNFLVLVPKCLETLIIEAEKLSLDRDDLAEIETGLWALPKSLTSFSLRLTADPIGLLLTSKMIALLPRNLRSLELSPVSIVLPLSTPELSDDDLPKELSCMSISTAFSPSSRRELVKRRIIRWIRSRQEIPLAPLKAALSSLPECCWCTFGIRALVDGDCDLWLEFPEPEFSRSFAKLLPIPVVWTSNDSFKPR